MCMFCAAIPAALAVGVKLDSEERKNIRQAQAVEDESSKSRIPVEPLTALAVSVLLAASLVYHTQLAG